jgi:hypothetical protein
MGMRKPGPPLRQRGVKFTPREIEWLDDESGRLGISTSEIIRRAIDEYIDRQERLIPRQRRKSLKTTETRQMSLDKMAA